MTLMLSSLAGHLAYYSSSLQKTQERLQSMAHTNQYSLNGFAIALFWACAALFVQIAIAAGWSAKIPQPVPYSFLLAILFFAGRQYWPVCVAVCLLRQLFILEQPVITAAILSLAFTSLALAVAFADKRIFNTPVALNAPKDITRLLLNALLLALLAVALEELILALDLGQPAVPHSAQFTIFENGVRLFSHFSFLLFLTTVLSTSLNKQNLQKQSLEFFGVVLLGAAFGYSLFYNQSSTLLYFNSYVLFVITPLIGLRLGTLGVALFALTLFLSALLSFGGAVETSANTSSLSIDEIRSLTIFLTLSGLLTSVIFRGFEQQKKLIQEQTNSLKIAANVFASIGEAIAVTDLQNKILSVNPSFEKLIGQTGDSLLGNGITSYIFDQPAQPAMLSMWQQLDATEHWEGTIQVGSLSQAHTTHHLVIYSHGQNRASSTRTWLFSPTTSSKLARATIYRQANFDTLTGLANRTLLFASLNRLLEAGPAKSAGFTVIFIDMDNLKNINDSLGHAAGDLVLTEVASRLKRGLRDGLVARLGGDEFALLSHGGTTDEQIAAQVNAIYKSFGPALRVQDFDLQISLSAGVARYPDDGLNAKDLVMHADLAMYAAKKSGKNCYRLFEPWMQQQANQTLRLQEEIKEGLTQDSFELYFQPIVELQSGAVIMAEALLRWNLPDGTQRLPGDFIAKAEDNGAIIALGEFVFKSASKFAAQLRLKHPDFLIALNISARQFDGRENHTYHWPAYLASQGLSPQALCLEVTERLLLNSTQQVSIRINHLKEVGFKFSIDDFGTGYSSFAALQTTRFSYLKIDKSFTSTLTTKAESQILIKSIIDLAKNLGLHCIAEGIETAAQLKLLQDLGCRSGQGYYLHRPVNRQQLEHLIDLPPSQTVLLTQQATPT